VSDTDGASTVSTWRADPTWPDVDVVMPIRNEAPHLAGAIDSVRRQAYPGRVRTILGVGPSTDGTEAIADRLAAESDDLIVVTNPSGRTPSALNAAIRAGSAPVVVRVDGHSELSAGYIRRAVDILRETGAANVGGIQRPEPTTPFEQAVADATTSLLGTGGASYRVGSKAGAVDTVYLGVFDRAAIEAVGLFDEQLIRNQDYEFNIRLRDAGRTVWFDPTLSVGYRPRSTWSAVARQYYEYGWWKAVVLRMHPRSLRLRQLIPPVGILGVVLGLTIGVRWRPALIVPVAYAVAIAGSVRSSHSRLRTSALLAVVHAAWATGIVRSMVSRSAGSDERLDSGTDLSMSPVTGTVPGE
jgi:glycosyltransferase involved in cell wall biosynthesis